MKFSKLLFMICTFFLFNIAFARTVLVKQATIRVHNGIYAAHIGQDETLGTYRISVPQAKDPEIYATMDSAELFDRDQSSVTFGPSALDGMQYTVRVWKNKPVYRDFNKEMKSITEGYIDYLQKTYRTPVSVLYQTKITYREFPGFYTIYSQKVHYKNSNDTYTLIHAVYRIVHKNYGVIFSTALTNSLDDINHINPKIMASLKNQTFKPQIDFINSFKLNLKSDRKSQS